MTLPTLLANLLLAAASLLYLLLISQIYLKPMPGGDYGVGYAWMAIFLNGGFLICIALAALALSAGGGFQWVKADGHSMGWVVLGILSIAFVTTVSGMGANEGPYFLRLLMRSLAYLLPLLTLAAGFGLANDALPGGVPAHWVRQLSMGAFWIGTGAAAIFFLVHMGLRTGYTRALIAERQSQDDEQHQSMLTYIDTCDLSKDMVFLFGYTDVNQPALLREHALARIHSYPQWEEELLRYLDSGWASEAFTFLASNSVDDPTRFPEAIRLGILQQAKAIREKLSASRNQYYSDSYYYDVKRLLRAVQKFNGMGVDYGPALRELRAAFSDEGQPYDAIKLIDKEMKALGI